MKRFMFACCVAFWASVASLWGYASLAANATGDSGATGRGTAHSVSAQELARHDSADDCWMAIDGVVYDFTRYLPEHPTPPVVVTAWCGREATEAYRTKGYGRPHSPAADALLPTYRIGRLEGTP